MQVNNPIDVNVLQQSFEDMRTTLQTFAIYSTDL